MECTQLYCTMCHRSKTGSSVHIYDSTVPAAQAGIMSKPGAQCMNLRMPPPGKPAASNGNTAQQTTALASQMAAWIVVTARKTRPSAVRVEHYDALMSTTSTESHDDEGDWESGAPDVRNYRKLDSANEVSSYNSNLRLVSAARSCQRDQN